MAEIEIQEINRELEDRKIADVFASMNEENKKKLLEERKIYITDLFRLLAKREMTDEEYEAYTKKFDSNEDKYKRYNVYMFIEQLNNKQSLTEYCRKNKIE
jgi:hypothetical protein